MSTQYHSYHEQHHRAPTAPRVASSVTCVSAVADGGTTSKKWAKNDQLLDCLLWTKMSCMMGADTKGNIVARITAQYCKITPFLYGVMGTMQYQTAIEVI